MKNDRLKGQISKEENRRLKNMLCYIKIDEAGNLIKKNHYKRLKPKLITKKDTKSAIKHKEEKYKEESIVYVGNDKYFLIENIPDKGYFVRTDNNEPDGDIIEIVGREKKNWTLYYKKKYNIELCGRVKFERVNIGEKDREEKWTLVPAFEQYKDFLHPVDVVSLIKQENGPIEKDSDIMFFEKEEESSAKQTQKQNEQNEETKYKNYKIEIYSGKYIFSSDGRCGMDSKKKTQLEKKITCCKINHFDEVFISQSEANRIAENSNDTEEEEVQKNYRIPIHIIKAEYINKGSESKTTKDPIINTIKSKKQTKKEDNNKDSQDKKTEIPIINTIKIKSKKKNQIQRNKIEDKKSNKEEEDKKSVNTNIEDEQSVNSSNKNPKSKKEEKPLNHENILAGIIKGKKNGKNIKINGQVHRGINNIPKPKGKYGTGEGNTNNGIPRAKENEERNNKNITTNGKTNTIKNKLANTLNKQLSNKNEDKIIVGSKDLDKISLTGSNNGFNSGGKKQNDRVPESKKEYVEIISNQTAKVEENKNKNNDKKINNNQTEKKAEKKAEKKEVIQKTNNIPTTKKGNKTGNLKPFQVQSFSLLAKKEDKKANEQYNNEALKKEKSELNQKLEKQNKEISDFKKKTTEEQYQELLKKDKIIQDLKKEVQQLKETNAKTITYQKEIIMNDDFAGKKDRMFSQENNITLQLIGHKEITNSNNGIGRANNISIHDDKYKKPFASTIIGTNHISKENEEKLQSEINELKKKLEDKEDKTKVLENTIQQYKEKETKWETTKKELNNKIKEKDKVIKQKEEEARLTGEYEIKKYFQKRNEDRINLLEQEKKKLAEENRALEAQNRELEAQKSKLEKQIKETKNYDIKKITDADRDQFNKKVEEFNKKVEEFNKEKEEIKQQFNEAWIQKENIINDLKKKNHGNNGQYSSSNTKIKQRKTKISRRHTKISKSK